MQGHTKTSFQESICRACHYENKTKNIDFSMLLHNKGHVVAVTWKVSLYYVEAEQRILWKVAAAWRSI